MTPRRILFVCLQNSVHVAKWIDLIADCGWELHFFPVDALAPHDLLRGGTIHWPMQKGNPVQGPQFVSKVFVKPFVPTENAMAWMIPSDGAAAVPAESYRPFFGANGPGVLAGLIRELKPDLIHSMEFQHCGYLVLRAKELLGRDFPPWLATNWGSDIFLFRHQAEHETQIRRLLAEADYYSCECRRDIPLARELGFKGHILPVLPNSGGFDLGSVAELRSKERPSERKAIMVKGYQHFAGRAMTLLSILEDIHVQLKGHPIFLFSATADSRTRARELAENGLLDIRIVDFVSHETILSYFAQSRLYMSVSLGDGISTSALEAMALGAFPIQTNTSCCDEWFADGEGGFLVAPDRPDTIRDRILVALQDDNLVDRAAEINWKTVSARLDRRRLRVQLEEFYDELFQKMEERRAAVPTMSFLRSYIRERLRRLVGSWTHAQFPGAVAERDAAVRLALEAQTVTMRQREEIGTLKAEIEALRAVLAAIGQEVQNSRRDDTEKLEAVNGLVKKVPAPWTKQH